MNQLEEEKRLLQTENQRLKGCVEAQQLHCHTLSKNVEQELRSGSWRLAPVAGRIRALLAQPQSFALTELTAEQADQGQQEKAPVTLF
ncbi:hypothetical protein WJX73_006613 [Symbiochloris irregularis]|uniref:Uncharacterized protein n=1 Tax=Symbiochloris irregularis TaxID=706552 RepID=A0AAW1P4R3_9CHLO